ncbi:glutamate--tRNA ligase [Algoriphagus halophytocola]|uniref:Glutamate--tRNA ligase n=1 Tax=Algoriphagus halophytocola TaxID=2991499 RepID=A0ABY6MFS6_9BACT|nr:MULTISPECIES: glutamate--tRNA ligase [unclassified Algoriphagus]UZD22033.1 glutamate--tRNA ligase [Algoriphagus sp. TR-M5]WBL43284.1 glutamate--tRNA ligase [Algoriphagus sp. TR-M9]
MSTEVRVRFAPSPTGPLHIGGVRTALYNYLFARKMGGKFLLRIEDTDQTRFVPGAEEYIRESLEWLGITPDESPWNPGAVGPYRQSERKPDYMQYALDLVKKGHAYYAFDTSEELEAMRERLTAARVVQPQYNSITRTQMKNSLTLSEEEVKERLASGDPYVIRVKIPRKEEVRLNDMIRGWVMVQSSTLDDKVLMKSDGMPTYHLANIVDDHLMGITHVIRGEEWLPSAPLHVLLYKFFGWEDTMPEFAHLPLLLKPDGNGKLSKRDGDKLGFPVFPLNWENKENGETAAGFREQGYFSDAFLNFLAFLGWNPGDEREIFSLKELIEAFSIERIGKAGTKFDISKAKWYNEQYLRQKSNAELAQYVVSDAALEEVTILPETAEAIVALMKDRVVFTSEIWEGCKFVVISPTEFDQGVASKRWNSDAVTVLTAYAEMLEAFKGTDFDADTAKTMLGEAAEAKEIKLGKVMQAVRLAVTGVGAGPDLMQIFAILGAEEVAKRIRFALATLEVIG